MDKQEFIAKWVASERATCLGNRARAMFNADSVAAKAAAEWDARNTPEYLAREAAIAKFVARGGKRWDGGGKTRVYFNGVQVGAVGRTFDCYIDIDSGAINGALTDEEKAAANAAILGAE